MRLLEVSREVTNGQVRLAGKVLRENAKAPVEVYFAYPEAYADWVVESADPFAIALLVPAMFEAEDLTLDVPISPRLIRRLPAIRDALASWQSKLHRVAVHATAAPPRQPASSGRALAFFSAGVDSFYTALKRVRREPLSDPLTHLLFMRGIETPLEEIAGFDESLAHVQAASSDLGLTCMSGETNIRTFFTRHWERYYVGSGLAATATSLSGGVDTAFIPASSSYLSPHWSGTNILTDAMFSSEYLDIVYDGAEAGRAQKVAAISEWDPGLVLQHLRVCIRNNGGAWNCGKCYKCARTAMMLALVDNLPETGLFADAPSKHWRSQLRADHVTYLKESLALARARGAHPDLTRLLTKLVNRRMRHDAAVTFVRHTPVAGLVPLLQRIRTGLGIAPRER